MIERLRFRLFRPFGDAERHRAFTIAALILIALAAVLTTIGQQPGRENTGPSPAADPSAGPIDAAQGSASAYVPPGVGRVGRRFLHGYLNHLYGRASAREIKGATPALRRRLSSRHIRISLGMRGRRPQITSLETHPLNGDWLVIADLTDGEARFPVEVILTERAGGWVVAQVVED